MKEKTPKTPESTPESRKLQELLDKIPRWQRFFRRADYARLGTSIIIRETDLRRRSGHSDRVSEASAAKCRILLEEATASLKRGRVSAGWEFLTAVDREILMSLTPGELEAQRASAVAEAAEKLHGWRKTAALQLLEKPERDTGPSPERVQEAFFHLHEGSHNMYRKLTRLRRQLKFVSLYVALIVLGLLLINASGGLAPLGRRIEEVLPLAVLSGLLGGVLSLAYSVARWDPSRKIPEVSASFAVTLVRPLIGAAIALPVAFFLESGLLDLDEENRIWIIMAFCFLGGFSERWFLGLVKRLEES